MTGINDGSYRYTGNVIDQARLSTATGRIINVDTTTPGITFTGTTPANNTWISGNIFTPQREISELNLGQFTRNRNGTQYPVYDSGLVLMYNLDNITALDESGTLVKDMSPYANNGTIVGATWTGNGKRNGAYQFSSGTYITLPNNLGYTTQVSAFAWFKAAGTPPGGYHIIF